MDTFVEITKKAGILIEALPYIQRFKGSVFVVKYGGAFMDDPNPEVRGMVAQDIAFLASVGIRVVVIHGGGKAINRAMSASGLQAKFLNGLRVTDANAIKIVENVLNGEVNSEICKLLDSHGCPAQSVRGNDVLVCKKHYSKGPSGEILDLGFVGEVYRVNAADILDVLAHGKTPVVSPIALDDNGLVYNTNADVAAAAVARALQARRLVFLCDVAGLMRDTKDPSTLISHLKLSQVDSLKESGVIGGGMTPKVDSGVEALRNGVRRVHFIDGYMPHSLLLEIFTDQGIGTEIVNDSI